MLLDPGGTLAFFRTTAGKELHDFLREIGWLAGGKDAVNRLRDRLRRHETQHRDMVDLRELKPECREVDVAPTVEELLRALVGSPSWRLTRKPRRPQVGRLLPFAGRLAFWPPPAWWPFVQRRRTSSLVRVVT